MDPRLDHASLLNRRALLQRTAGGLGAAAMASLLGPQAMGQGFLSPAPKAKRVIYLFMSGAPSPLDMWDPKPGLRDRFDEDLPESIRQGQRITTMTSGQERFPVAPSVFDFAQHGETGTWVSELLPHTAKIVDDLTIVKSVHTEAINHDPAMTFMATGSELPGRPSMGSWLSHGLGSMNADLPTYVVLHATWTGRQEAQALFSRLWGSGFLPSRHQGVALRTNGDPVLYLADPPGIDPPRRRRMLDRLAELNELHHAEMGDPETRTRIAQYEMAYRMQTSVPELMDLSGEDEATYELYGEDARKPGTFAASCLLARRMAERDVRFTQIYHRGWDQHFNLPGDHRKQCKDIDQACAGLITDLKQRGMLDDTLVVWGSEFGRTVYCQGALTKEDYGRDHHPRCFTMWFAGGGMKPGVSYGATDDYGYNITENPVHVHDVNATILHQLGIDHEKLTHLYQGRDFRLTDVHGRVMEDLIT
jgi:hypothetical protein